MINFNLSIEVNRVNKVVNNLDNLRRFPIRIRSAKKKSTAVILVRSTSPHQYHYSFGTGGLPAPPGHTSSSTREWSTSWWWFYCWCHHNYHKDGRLLIAEACGTATTIGKFSVSEIQGHLFDFTEHCLDIPKESDSETFSIIAVAWLSTG